jgi:Ca2+-binding EF-hand superfamily protein
MPRLWTLKFALVLAGASAIALGGCSSTSPGLSDTIEGSFIRAAPTWDLNRDGKVTCEEWKTYARSLFKEVDVNRTGKLTPADFEKLAKLDRLFEAANFKYYDVNRQGYVTEAEFVERPNLAFATLDRDNACVLSTYQLRAATSESASPKKENPGIPGSR